MRGNRSERAATAVVSLALLTTASVLGAPGLAGATGSRADWAQQGVLTARNAAAGDGFGTVAIAQSGTTAIVGAPGKATKGRHVAGAAFVFVNKGHGWVQQTELTASDPAVADGFGTSVSITKDGSSVVVGAPYKIRDGKTNAGAAYVFTRSGTTWTQQAELLTAPAGAGLYFGQSVAINGIATTIAVAAPSKSVGAVHHAGAVYVFKRAGRVWSQNAFLTEPEPATNDYFGWAVGAKETQVLASSPFHVNADGSSGAVYGFDDPAGTYAHQTTLTAADGHAGDEFGASLSISVATMVVGAPDHVGTNGTGTVSVFTHNDRTGVWTPRAELAPPDGNASDDFGSEVAISETNVAVGDPGHDVGANADQGEVYVFSGAGSTWSVPAELTASDGGPKTAFGQHVGVSTTNVMVGEPAHAVGALTGAGLVDVFG